MTDLDTLKMVRKMWKHFAPGDMYHIDYNTGCMSLRPEGILLLQASVDALDALIARMEHAPETPTAVVANWMIENGYITGHGDTVADLLSELVEQARMEQYTGRDAGIAEDASTRKDEDEAKAGIPTSPASSPDVEALVGKLWAAKNNFCDCDSSNGCLPAQIASAFEETIRAHFNAAGEKGE